MNNKPSFPPRTYAEARAYYAQADINNAIQTADMEAVQRGRAEGRAEGLAEGLAEGRAEGQAEGQAEEKTATARRMKALGLDTVLVAKVTGLPIEEIEKL